MIYVQEAITPLNLSNYLHDPKEHTKQTSQLEDLKISCMHNKKYVRLFNHIMNYMDCSN